MNWQYDLSRPKKCQYTILARISSHFKPCSSPNVVDVVPLTRHDYGHSVLFGVLSKNAARLQRAQNAVLRVVVWSSRRRSANSSVLLKQLHWLSTEWHIQFKIACITYNNASTIQLAYLYSLLNITSRLILCIHPTQLLFVPHVRICFGSRTFAVAAPIICLSFPLAICSNVSTHSFWRQLKIYFYISPFWPPEYPMHASQRLIFGRPFADIERFTNLHTTRPGLFLISTLLVLLKKQFFRSEQLKQLQFIIVLMIT